MTTAAARTAAARTRDLADIITSRTAPHHTPGIRQRMVDYLATAADAFENCDGTVTPFNAAAALLQCQALADNHPACGVAEDVFYYVAAPLTHFNPEMPGLIPVSPALAAEEGRLRTRIRLAAHDLDRASNAATRYAILATLADLHHDFDRLTERVDSDNYRAKYSH